MCKGIFNADTQSARNRLDRRSRHVLPSNMSLYRFATRSEPTFYEKTEKTRRKDIAGVRSAVGHDYDCPVPTKILSLIRVPSRPKRSTPSRAPVPRSCWLRATWTLADTSKFFFTLFMSSGTHIDKTEKETNTIHRRIDHGSYVCKKIIDAKTHTFTCHDNRVFSWSQ